MTLRTPGMSLLLDLAEVFHFYNSEKKEKLAAFVLPVFDSPERLLRVFLEGS